MEISEIRIYPTKSKGILAYCSVVVAGSLVIKGIKVMNGKNGLFAAMPSVKGNDGKFYDTVFTITKESRDAMNAAIISAYEAELAKGQAA